MTSDRVTHSGDGSVRVAMWSGPRNLCTALMRSFENRPDTVVVDEPLYASYLARTGIDHPGRDERDRQPADRPGRGGARPARAAPGWARTCSTSSTWPTTCCPDDDLGWTRDFVNVLLIRDPAEVVASYVRSRESCEPEDIGLLQQLRLLETWAETPPVIDAGDFLRTRRRTCAGCATGWASRSPPAMLSWPAGPRESDGVWAPYWYDAVWRSTGFEPWRKREVSSQRARRPGRGGVPPCLRHPARAPGAALTPVVSASIGPRRSWTDTLTGRS